MYRDIAEIRQFYNATLGRVTATKLARHIRQIWPQDMLDKTTLVGVGYAIPYLARIDHPNSFAVMSATQGVVRWPSNGPCRTVLTEDHILPLNDASAEHILLVHAIENADYLRELMNEVWRVLKPNGRVLIVVPNRAGLWANSDKTPFGYGRPFSMKQLRSLLGDLQFVIEGHRRALYFLPSHNRILLTMAPVLEKLGSILMPKFGGVILVEATKRLYNVTPLKTSPVVKSSPITEWTAKPVPSG